MDTIHPFILQTREAAQLYAGPSVDNLIGWMSGHPSTSKWDIVCSYSVKQLNAFLQDQYDAGKLAKKIQLTSVRQDPFTEQTFTIQYDVLFSSPTLSFIAGRSGMATLTMEILDGSSYTIKETGKKGPIPGSTYAVQCVVPLAAMSGNTGAITDVGNVISFFDGKRDENHIIVHFKNAKGATYQIIPTPDTADKDVLMYFLQVLENYFQTEVKEIDYALTSVNNTQATQGVILTPESFVFASSGDDTDGVLSLYIKIVGSGNPSGDLNPSFQPGNNQTQPIPGQYSASLIFSYDLITKFYLNSQLTAKGYLVKFYVDPDAPSGISMNLTTKTSIVVPGYNEHYIFGSSKYEKLEIQIDANNPMKLAIRNSAITLNWINDEKKSEWTANDMGGRHNGTVYITISLNKKDPIPFPVLTDRSMHLLNITLDSSCFSVTFRAEERSFFDDPSKSGKVPPYYNSIKLSAPDIDLVLDGIDFFATTNLLSPGQQVIQFDTTAGIKTPYDFMLLGYVKSSH